MLGEFIEKLVVCLVIYDPGLCESPQRCFWSNFNFFVCLFTKA